MNKMHSLAKIILTALALYIAYQLSITLLSILFMIGLTDFDKSPIFYIALPFVALLLPAVIIYQLLYKRDKWAEKIVGAADLPCPKSQINWLPIAFRLASVTAGLYSLLHFVSGLSRALSYYARIKAYDSIYPQNAFATERIIGWVLLLPIAIYLLCGAPHFVRWQVKKALEQCKHPPETEENHRPQVEG